MIAVLLSVAALASAPPEVALLCSRGDGDITELRFERPGEPLAPAVAHFSHVPRATALGALLPGSRTVLAVAQTLNARDPSFASSLLRLEPGNDPVPLATGLALASRPLVTRTGRVFVQRATVDEVNPRSGALRTVLPGLAWLAGEADSELILYRLTDSAAELIAVHENTLSVRVLARIAPFARDFVVDGHTLYFTQIDREQWQVQRLDLRTRELAFVAHGPHVAMLPTVLPSGLAFSPGPGLGLRTAAGERALASQGPGFDRVRFVRGGWALGLNEVPSDFPTGFAVELTSGRRLELAAPAQSRLDVAGAVE
jgi:hypothetical protein